MAVCPITGHSFPWINPTDRLVDQALLEIFNFVLVQRALRFPVSTLALVCKRWKHITDSVQFGKRFLESIGLSLPTWTYNWKDAYEYQMGYPFITHDFKARTVSFCQAIDLQAEGQITWVENEGFVQFIENQFRVCRFSHPTEVWPVNTSKPITALEVIHQQIVCALENGMVEVYSFESLELLFSYKAHSSNIYALFPFQESWISIARDGVKQWDPPNGVVQTLFKPATRWNTRTFHCTGNQLFFQDEDCMDISTESSSDTGVFIWALDLLNPQKGACKIDYPITGTLEIFGRGDHLVFVNPSKGGIQQFDRFPINPVHTYTGTEEGFEFELEGVPCVSGIFPSGTIAFIIKASDAYPDIYARNGQFIELRDLRNAETLLLYFVSGGIASNREGFICTIMGNCFVFCLAASNTLVFLEFSKFKPKLEPDPIDRDEYGEARPKRQRKE